MPEIDDETNFLKLFKDAPSYGIKKGINNYVISDQVTRYIQRCCGNRPELLKLLKSNGFKIYTGGRPDPKKINREKPYDEEIFAEKISTFPFFYSYRTYRIFIYLVDDKVDRLLAHSFVDGL